HTEVDVSGWVKLDEIPFDFERRRVSVLVRRGGEPPILIVKGAVEDVLDNCLACEFGRGAPPTIAVGQRPPLVGQFEELSREGFRVLGIAWKQVPAGVVKVAKTDERGLTFAGFAAFQDPPKQSARDALQSLADLGVGVKVVTGDNELVAQHVCRELGLPVSGTLTGADVQGMDDTVLDARVEQASLFCRVTPVQKNRIILALKR